MTTTTFTLAETHKKVAPHTVNIALLLSNRLPKSGCLPSIPKGTASGWRRGIFLLHMAVHVMW